MQYCYLKHLDSYIHHRTHPQLSVISALACCFIHSGTLSSSHLLFPVGILDTFRPGGFIFWCHIFLLFRQFCEVLMANILGWFTIPFSRSTFPARSPCYDLSILGSPWVYGMAKSFIVTLSTFTTTRERMYGFTTISELPFL